MKRFIVTEIQTVFAVREVEAEDETHAATLFNDGEGRSCGKDGEIIEARHISTEIVE